MILSSVGLSFCGRLFQMTSAALWNTESSTNERHPWAMEAEMLVVLTGLFAAVNDEAVGIVVEIRLGAGLCEPHQCPGGAEVCPEDTHGLACRLQMLCQQNNSPPRIERPRAVSAWSRQRTCSQGTGWSPEFRRKTSLCIWLANVRPDTWRSSTVLSHIYLPPLWCLSDLDFVLHQHHIDKHWLRGHLLIALNCVFWHNVRITISIRLASAGAWTKRHEIYLSGRKGTSSAAYMSTKLNRCVHLADFIKLSKYHRFNCSSFNAVMCWIYLVSTGDIGIAESVNSWKILEVKVVLTTWVVYKHTTL